MSIGIISSLLSAILGLIVLFYQRRTYRMVTKIQTDSAATNLSFQKNIQDQVGLLSDLFRSHQEAVAHIVSDSLRQSADAGARVGKLIEQLKTDFEEQARVEKTLGL